jgi:hypothetical protein
MDDLKTDLLNPEPWSEDGEESEISLRSTQFKQSYRPIIADGV